MDFKSPSNVMGLMSLLHHRSIKDIDFLELPDYDVYKYPITDGHFDQMTAGIAGVGFSPEILDSSLVFVHENKLTRLPVKHIGEMLYRYKDKALEDILEDYSYLTDDQILFAFCYYCLCCNKLYIP